MKFIINLIDKYFYCLLVAVVLLIASSGFALILYNAGIIGRTVQIGDVYVSKNADDPFTEYETNSVIAIKDGWVLLQNQLNQKSSDRITSLRGFNKYVGNTAKLEK